MKSLAQFIKTTLLGGIIFLLPVVITVLLLGKAFRTVAVFSQPIAQKLPFQSAFGIAAVHIVAILALLIVAFLAGLAARTGFGDRLTRKLEQMAMLRVPGYTMLKNISQDMFRIESNANWEVVLANIDDAWLLSFIVERHQSGMLAVFVPSVPTPTAGSLYFLTEQQVKRIDVSVANAVSCIKRLGVGSQELLNKAGFSNT